MMAPVRIWGGGDGDDVRDAPPCVQVGPACGPSGASLRSILRETAAPSFGFFDGLLADPHLDPLPQVGQPAAVLQGQGLMRHRAEPPSTLQGPRQCGPVEHVAEGGADRVHHELAVQAAAKLRRGLMHKSSKKAPLGGGGGGYAGAGGSGALSSGGAGREKVGGVMSKPFHCQSCANCTGPLHCSPELCKLHGPPPLFPPGHHGLVGVRGDPQHDVFQRAPVLRDQYGV
eukprot:CAMPEP_0179217886 /NCGR_PEP_ID=MMETSP0797-20121207/4160_1 /TAXON_ID=47934 /ORGANISM="Dinophysis acuminata, Strain DAEP01" /LENGTH=228 /DNA_ID=CAMNT_0020924159 /DNA_START=20 /DNA_END=705 /DNA_ORIENTATION=-